MTLLYSIFSLGPVTSVLFVHKPIQIDVSDLGRQIGLFLK